MFQVAHLVRISFRRRLAIKQDVKSSTRSKVESVFTNNLVVDVNGVTSRRTIRQITDVKAIDGVRTC